VSSSEVKRQERYWEAGIVVSTPQGASHEESFSRALAHGLAYLFGALNAIRPSPLGLRYGAQGELILIVADDDRVRAISCETLRDLGYTVIEAAGAREASAKSNGSKSRSPVYGCRDDPL
jgi:hypothetical protein